MLNKEELRTFFLSKGHSLEERKLKSRAIASSLASFLKKKPGVWGFFFPISPEPLLEPLFSKLDPSIKLSFPRIENKEEGSMKYYLVLKDALENKKSFVKGELGIWEPKKKESKELEKSAMSGILVPLFAFDLKGTRLGRGKGFYDRYLEDFSGIKLGLAFEWQKYEKELPCEPFDVKLDMLITEKKLYSFKSK